MEQWEHFVVRNRKNDPISNRLSLLAFAIKLQISEDRLTSPFEMNVDEV